MINKLTFTSNNMITTRTFGGKQVEVPQVVGKEMDNCYIFGEEKDNKKTIVSANLYYDGQRFVGTYHQLSSPDTKYSAGRLEQEGKGEELSLYSTPIALDRTSLENDIACFATPDMPSVSKPKNISINVRSGDEVYIIGQHEKAKGKFCNPARYYGPLGQNHKQTKKFKSGRKAHYLGILPYESSVVCQGISGARVVDSKGNSIGVAAVIYPNTGRISVVDINDVNEVYS